MRKSRNNRQSKMHNNLKGVGGLVVLLTVGLLVLALVSEFTRKVDLVSHSDFIRQIESGQVVSVDVRGQEISGVLKDGKKFETTVLNVPRTWDLLNEKGVHIKVHDAASQINIWSFLPMLSLLGLFLLALWFFRRQTQSSGGGGAPGIFSMGRSRARMFLPSQIKEKFSSVAGVEEAKEELKDIVDFLKEPEKYKRLGAKVPRGILLVGEPGNGKTLLARAVAGEANCPFFTISGADFIELFAGVGAARVRDLFAQARKNAPAIIFIDEIDAIGRQRSVSAGAGSHEEREQTLNQLLTEMDGFQTKPGNVIVLAATNRPDILDKALLRPGRFDRRVEVPYPDVKSREEILRLHAKSFKVDDSVDFKKIAHGTSGLTGADLANLINEAALVATKAGDELIKVSHFEEARDKVLLGKKIKSKILSNYEKKVTAYHEAGHALVLLLLPDETEPLHKVTIIPRGGALGVTHWIPEREKYITSKEQLEAMIAVALGGRVAEEITFDKLTTGAYSDFLKATDIAQKMVRYYGMHPTVGTIVRSGNYEDYPYSQKVASEIDDAVKSVVESAHKRTKELLMGSKDKLKKLADALLERETLHANEVYELLEIEPRKDHSFE